ncbi:unnamed protein product [Linum tenue]|uniref:Uncharacterized protein n=1 Tax=Linum tenue TaxID=586396 RepID=A0AAV0KRG7_9ROSI|nr:unnamed protein product [Linum tenue]
MNRLHELDKHLLDKDDDNDDEEGSGGDTVFVITNTNSNWSETIQNLISGESRQPASFESAQPSTALDSLLKDERPGRTTRYSDDLNFSLLHGLGSLWRGTSGEWRPSSSPPVTVCRPFLVSDPMRKKEPEFYTDDVIKSLILGL